MVLARFAPIIRTFAPFVAGVAKMCYRRYLAFSILGAVLWIGGFLYVGFFFGNLAVVKRNFTLIVAAIIVVSLLPAVLEVIRSRRAKAAPPQTESGR